MSASHTIIGWRLLPVVLVAAAAGLWFNDVQDGGEWVLRNLLPLLLLVILAALALHRGAGHWTGAGKRYALGVLGFAVPALGLSVYLHYAYSVNLNGMFTDAVYPERVFRYLPYYTIIAGGIGFVIGWIVGRNVERQSTL
tara:strand:+ start:14356 stop:14775 length:420 start_codon:yes stop_codon:yes gene_type:complete